MNGSPSPAGTVAGRGLASWTIGNATSCGSVVTIKKPDGSTQASNNCVTTSGAVISTTLAVAGTYTIVVDPQGNRTGSMTLTLTDPPFVTTALFDQPALRLGGANARQAPPWIAPRGPRRVSPHRLSPHRSATPKAKPPAPNLTFDPPDAEDFTPGARQRNGDWRRHLPRSPWSSIAPLRAPSGTTALSGQTLTLNGKPLAEVAVELEDTGLSTTTDDSGRFLLSGTPDGHRC
ncbi:MAG: hypothetical protein ABI927_00270 [Gaiellaceae bacterium]